MTRDAAAFFRSLAGALEPALGTDRARSVTRRVKTVYDTLPLPPGAIAEIGTDRVLSRLRPVPLPGSRVLHKVAGSALVIAGVGLNLWALAERQRHTAGTFALEQPEGLVSTGPYAFSRHPMYVGWWLIELGAGTLAGSSWIPAMMPAQLLVEHRLVVREENVLAGLFGDSYRAYAGRVPRYLGMPRAWDAGDLQPWTPDRKG